jgi:hypothetical protein
VKIPRLHQSGYFNKTAHSVSCSRENLVLFFSVLSSTDGSHNRSLPGQTDNRTSGLAQFEIDMSLGNFREADSLGDVGLDITALQESKDVQQVSLKGIENRKSQVSYFSSHACQTMRSNLTLNCLGSFLKLDHTS